MSQVEENPTFRFAIPNVPPVLESTAVNSFTDYIILEHLSRRLIGYNSEGELEGDLAALWTVDSERTCYKFKLKANQSFSDGSRVDAVAAIESFQRSVGVEDTVHYNFRAIERLTLIDDLSFEITLKKSDPNFLSSLVHPEFSILSSRDRNAELGRQRFEVTSGYYSLASNADGSLLCLTNHYIGEFGRRPKLLQFIDSSSLEFDANSSFSKKIDVYWSGADLTKVTHDSLLAHGYSHVMPSIGFTFWISLNPTHSSMREHANRRQLQIVIRDLVDRLEMPLPALSRASQLYLESGPGRPKAADLEKAYSTQKRTEMGMRPTIQPVLRALFSSRFVFQVQVSDALESAGFRVDLQTYDNSNRYADSIKNRDQYALLQVNNDFSALDLTDSLNVAFNPSRPLIILSDSQNDISAMIDLLNQTPNDERKNALISQIGINLIAEALVAPIYHKTLSVYVRNGLDTSSWSTLSPDISVWKLKEGR